MHWELRAATDGLLIVDSYTSLVLKGSQTSHVPRICKRTRQDFDQPQILQWLFSVATEASELLVGGVTDSLKACFEDVLGFPLVVFFNVNNLVLGFLN